MRSMVPAFLVQVARFQKAKDEKNQRLGMTAPCAAHGEFYRLKLKQQVQFQWRQQVQEQEEQEQPNQREQREEREQREQQEQ